MLRPFRRNLLKLVLHNFWTFYMYYLQEMLNSLTCLRLNKLMFQVGFRPIPDEPLLKCVDIVRRKLMFGHYWVNMGLTV